MVFERRSSRLVAVIVLGTMLGGAAGFYFRENIHIKQQEKVLLELEKNVEQKKLSIKELRSKLGTDK